LHDRAEKSSIFAALPAFPRPLIRLEAASAKATPTQDFPRRAQRYASLNHILGGKAILNAKAILSSSSPTQKRYAGARLTLAAVAAP
jgi:hypothetical protein